MRTKILIIRFSSFGDIAQCMSITPHLKRLFPDCEIHFLTKAQFVEFVSLDPCIDKTISLKSSDGLKGLWSIRRSIGKEDYDYVYDAHNSLRSLLLFIFMAGYFGRKYLMRPKSRLRRFLLFVLKINTFEKKFRGAYSYFLPLKKWGLQEPFQMLHRDWGIEKKHGDYAVFAPSAAWEMKRWPVEYWKSLLKLSAVKIHFLGGPGDDFVEEIVKSAPEKCENFSGKLSLKESCEQVYNARYVVSADTGILHVADIMNKKCFALMGPTAFGFPSSDSAKVLEVELSCRPCSKDGRGNCSQEVYQKCMVDILPKKVQKEISAFTS